MVGQAIDLLVGQGTIVTAFACSDTLGLGCKASTTAMAAEEMTISSAVSTTSTCRGACFTTLASAAGCTACIGAAGLIPTGVVTGISATTGGCRTGREAFGKGFGGGLGG